jgi:hypothetical protein
MFPAFTYLDKSGDGTSRGNPETVTRLKSGLT